MRTPKTNRGRATRLLCAVRNSLLALALLAWGCGSSHHVIGAGFEIDEVELQGVKRFSKGALLRHLYSGESSWLPMAPDQPFDEVREQLKRWWVATRLGAALDRYFRNARSRVTVRVIG